MRGYFLFTTGLTYYFKYCLPCGRHEKKNQVNFLPIDACCIVDISRVLHGNFTAVVYCDKAYHGYTVVASYHIPYRLKTVQFSENRTISTIYHFVP